MHYSTTCFSFFVTHIFRSTFRLHFTLLLWRKFSISSQINNIFHFFLQNSFLNNCLFQFVLVPCFFIVFFKHLHNIVKQEIYHHQILKRFLSAAKTIARKQRWLFCQSTYAMQNIFQPKILIVIVLEKER